MNYHSPRYCSGGAAVWFRLYSCLQVNSDELCCAWLGIWYVASRVCKDPLSQLSWDLSGFDCGRPAFGTEHEVSWTILLLPFSEQLIHLRWTITPILPAGLCTSSVELLKLELCLRQRELVAVGDMQQDSVEQETTPQGGLEAF